jgi:hypothetical protein
VLGIEQCKGDQPSSQRLLKTLGSNEREAFTIGCALSETMPKPASFTSERD